MERILFGLSTLLILGQIALQTACNCPEDWNAQAQAQKWSEQMGLRNIMIDCWNHNDNCHAECSVSYDDGKGTGVGHIGRTVISVTCVHPEGFGGDIKGKCYKVVR